MGVPRLRGLQAPSQVDLTRDKWTVGQHAGNRHSKMLVPTAFLLDISPGLCGVLGGNEQLNTVSVFNACIGDRELTLRLTQTLQRAEELSLSKS